MQTGEEEKKVVLWFTKSWLRARWKQVRTTPVFISATFSLIMITKLSIFRWKNTFQYLCEGYLQNSFVFFAPYMPPLWVRGRRPSPRNHTGLFELLPFPKISCLLMMTRFRLRTWVGLCLCFRYGRDMVLIQKCSWLCGENFTALTKLYSNNQLFLHPGTVHFFFRTLKGPIENYLLKM